MVPQESHPKATVESDVTKVPHNRIPGIITVTSIKLTILLISRGFQHRYLNNVENNKYEWMVNEDNQQD